MDARLPSPGLNQHGSVVAEPSSALQFLANTPNALRARRRRADEDSASVFAGSSDHTAALAFCGVSPPVEDRRPGVADASSHVFWRRRTGWPGDALARSTCSSLHALAIADSVTLLCRRLQVEWGWDAGFEYHAQDSLPRPACLAACSDVAGSTAQSALIPLQQRRASTPHGRCRVQASCARTPRTWRAGCGLRRSGGSSWNTSTSFEGRPASSCSRTRHRGIVPVTTITSPVGDDAIQALDDVVEALQV